MNITNNSNAKLLILKSLKYSLRQRKEKETFPPDFLMKCISPKYSVTVQRMNEKYEALYTVAIYVFDVINPMENR